MLQYHVLSKGSLTQLLVDVPKKGKKERMQSTRPRSRHVTAIQGNYFKRDEISRILEGIRLL